MESKNLIDIIDIKDKPSVQAHITMLQGIIKRMASNSIQCKQWCIAIETVVFGIAMGNMDWWFFCMAVITAIIFMVLDAGYLCFERQFRNQQENFIEKINKGGSFEEDIFMVQPLDKSFCGIAKTALSKYVWTYYLLIIIFMLIFTIKE